MAVDHILFIIHGIGFTEEFETEKQQFNDAFKAAKEYCFWDVDVNIHVEVIEWKSAVFNTQKSLLERIAPSDGSEIKQLLHYTVNDLFFYISPEHGYSILSQVANRLNAEARRLREDPSGKFKTSKISILGYSLGSVIGYELLTQPLNRPVQLESNLPLPRLSFPVEIFFAMGSPIALFVSLFSSEFTKTSVLPLPSTKFYNIFLDFDPVAFRLEGLIYNHSNLPLAQIIPDWMSNGAKKWFYANYCDKKNTQEISNSLFTGNSRLKGAYQMTRAIAGSFLNNRRSSSRALPSQVQHDISDLPAVYDDASSQRKLQLMNTYDRTQFPIRYDYKLQGEESDLLLSPLAILKSHFLYWSSKDVCRFILKCLTNHDPSVSLYGHFVQLATEADALAENARKQGYTEEYYKQKAAAAQHLEKANELRSQAEKDDGVSFFSPRGLINRFVNTK